jgi:hypothetical protein
MIAMKCEICKEKIDTHILGKIIGAYIKDAKGKKHSVCARGQKLLKIRRSFFLP